MKKFISALMLLAFMATAGFAQIPAKTTSSQTTKTVETKQTNAPTKKDGTPDKRYKANQAAKPVVAGPTKKDGTPDKRFKANKAAPAKM